MEKDHEGVSEEVGVAVVDGLLLEVAEGDEESVGEELGEGDPLNDGETLSVLSAE